MARAALFCEGAIDIAAAQLLGGGSAKFQMIGESDYEKVKPVAPRPERPQAKKPWFQVRKNNHR